MPEQAERASSERAANGQFPNGDGLADEVVRLRLENLALRDGLIGANAELAELRSRLERREDQRVLSDGIWQLRLAQMKNELAIAADDSRQLHEMRESASWRVGRALVRPLHRARSWYRDV